MWQVLLLALVGVAAGWLNVMAGGGSLLTIPVMLFMGIPGPVANGTNRIAILAQNITAVTAFRRRGYSDFKLGFSLAAAASLGAIGGASVGVKLDGVWFDRVLALVMVGVMILMATGHDKIKPSGGESKAKNLFAGHLLMVGAGFWGGFIQIGVGFILMPILHRVLGLDLVRVNMHKVLIVLVYTIVALGIFAANLELMWWIGISLAIGNSIGGWLGAHTTITHGEGLIRRVLYLALSAFIIKLLFF
ncbi:MAG: sulfite exporter TauE/SafE family protein [Candidatus Thiodiazotropha taylori]|nr:sulfite exporter TauE/SafE family protein [Candidatus Thiodiazotropha taylori]MCG7936334.1 sulfite exporter TauE/SafE family protein [Candidatus Thiodiazotropha taylori]MCG7972805.1 sulfite exporter TauE/SafE family protein [Candidatus Thiodiazotropha taylori]MCG7972809.1 sulfite exporter TauE/SafE family protein [Candidatus Thiodiazotropha taylori]